MEIEKRIGFQPITKGLGFSSQTSATLSSTQETLLEEDRKKKRFSEKRKPEFQFENEDFVISEKKHFYFNPSLLSLFQVSAFAIDHFASVGLLSILLGLTAWMLEAPLSISFLSSSFIVLTLFYMFIHVGWTTFFRILLNSSLGEWAFDLQLKKELNWSESEFCIRALKHSIMGLICLPYRISPRWCLTLEQRKVF